MKFKKTICAACVATFFISGCATPGGDPATSSENNTAALRCAAFGAGGAVLGAVLGGTRGAVKGAIAGLAACAVVEIASRQTKTAAEVDQQYKVSNRNRLPPTAKIDAYATVVTPNGAVKAGDAIKVQSTIRAVSGTNEPVREIKEVLVAYAPTGEEFKRGEKLVNDTGGSGEYDNSFTLKLPQGAPQGIYRLQTQVFLNGRPGTMKESAMQVAEIDGMPTLALLDR
ncbi:hypothetical protein [Collimonas antrihumi]|uniref:hypothetical protein n=1 Tax=Collimonas antrihumi TaxID=1940615 RepID=UPI001B8CEB93|nr:hypothetical protein [Collimonas antrihumi]